MAIKGVISTPKIVIDKPQIIAKPEVVSMPKIVAKPKKVYKPKIVDKQENLIEKKYQNYDEYKNRVIRQLKHLFNVKKISTQIMMMKNTEE